VTVQKNFVLQVCDSAFNIYYIVDSGMLLNNTEYIVAFPWHHFYYSMSYFIYSWQWSVSQEWRELIVTFPWQQLLNKCATLSHYI